MGRDSHFTGLTVYSQVLKLLDKDKIHQISRETPGSDSYVKRFGSYEHLDENLIFFIFLYFFLSKFLYLKKLSYYCDPI
jgi:hypothetical protein